MADVKGSLEVGKNLLVGEKASINTNDTSNTFSVSGTAKFTEVKISSGGAYYKLPATPGTPNQLLVSQGDNANLVYKTLEGNDAVAIFTSGDTIRISAATTDLSEYITQTSAQALVSAAIVSSLSQLTNDQNFTSAAQFVGAGIIQVRVSGTGAGQQIIVSAATTQLAVQASALGGGSSVVIGTSANETRYRTFVGSGSIQVSAGANEITLSAAPNPTQLSQLTNDVDYITQTSAENLVNAVQITETTLGGGEAIIVTVSGGRDIQQRTITVGGGIHLSASPTELVLSAAPNPTQLSELTNNQGFVSANQFVGAGIIQVRVSGTGAGQQIFVSAASTQVVVQASALGGGSSVVIGTSANETRFRTFVGSGSIQVSAGATTIVVSAPVYNQVSALSQLTNNVGFVSANQFLGAGIIQVRVSGTSNGQQIIVSAANQIPTFTTTNLGGGQILSTGVSGNKDFTFRTITGGGIIGVSTSSNTINVSASNELNLFVNQTAHGFTTSQPIYYNASATRWELARANNEETLGIALVKFIDVNNFEAVFGGRISGISPEVQPGEYYFVSTSAVGLLTPVEPLSVSSYSNPILFAITSSTGLILPFRPSVGNGGIPVPEIAVQASALGGEQSLIVGVSANEIQLRTLAGGGNIEVTTNGNTVTISANTNLPTFTATNLGGGQNVAISVSANRDFTFRSLTGGGIIDARTSANTIVVSAADRTPTFTATNLGGAQEVALSVSANRDFTFRTITGGGAVEIRTSANTIVVSAAPASGTYNPFDGGQIITYTLNRSANNTTNTWLSFGSNNNSTNNVWGVIPFNCRLVSVAYSNTNQSVTADARLIKLLPSQNPNQSDIVYTHQIRSVRTYVNSFPTGGPTFNQGDFFGVYLADAGGGNDSTQPQITLTFITTSLTSAASTYNISGSLSTT